VHPWVERRLSSFVHDRLEAAGQLLDYELNRPESVRCLHPMVTLIEKLEAIARRYESGDPAAFVRHYEDTARIIGALDALPEIEMTISDLAQDMLAKKDMRALPGPDEPALRLDDADKRAIVEKAWAKIAPMFWGERIALDEACSTIRSWLAQQEWHS